VLTDAQREAVRFDDRGLVLAVVQQHDTGEVLMVAWMDSEALARTVDLGETVFYSRSRQQLWHKGATSGNVQRVVELRVDCDGDAIRYRVRDAEIRAGKRPAVVFEGDSFEDAERWCVDQLDACPFPIVPVRSGG
jgi:phosphoribosyl-AMP cyclohydrolase